MAKCPFNENLNCSDCELSENGVCILKTLKHIAFDLDYLEKISESLRKLADN